MFSGLCLQFRLLVSIVWLYLYLIYTFKNSITMNKTSKHLDYDKATRKGDQLIEQGDQLGLFILIALETGLRCGDILKLKKSDFFKEGSKYFIRFKAQKTKKEDVRGISELAFLQADNSINDTVFYNTI